MATVAESLFGVSPESLMATREQRLQEQAIQYGRMSPIEAARAGFYEAGSRLGTGIGGLLGAEDPELMRVRQRQQLLQGINPADPAKVKIIKNKIHQKLFYQQHEIPSADFAVLNSKDEIQDHHHLIPAAQKLATGGYDGKGVQLIHSKEDIQKGFDAPSVLEKMIDIEKEIAIIVAVGQDQSTTIYPPVEIVS